MIWFNGRVTDSVPLSPFAHGLNYSLGVFDTARAYLTPKGTAFFRLDDHLARLAQSAKFMGLKLPYPEREIRQAAFSLLEKTKSKQGYLRMNAFLAEEELRIFPSNRTVSLALTFQKINYTGKSFGQGLRCTLSTWRKPSDRIFPPGVKCSANYLPSYLALDEARKKGFDEAMMLDERGYLAEASAQNLFFVKGGRLVTPKGTLLQGITRDSVLKLAEKTGMRVVQKKVKPRDLFLSEEAFLTGTATEIMPVVQVDSIKFPVGPIAEKMQSEFRKVTRLEHPFSEKWMDFP